jgi:D-alanine--poly(phosphoribitol) ligase subunit 2
VEVLEMHDRERIEQLVYRVLDEMNAQLPPADALEKSPTTVLIGVGAALDSLGLVELVMRLQKAILKEYGLAVAVAGDVMLATAESPIRTVATLVEYLAKLVDEAQHG